MAAEIIRKGTGVGASHLMKHREYFHIADSDDSYLSRERVRSTFMEDFRALLTEAVPEERRVFDWSDPERDPQGMYVVDCRINGMARPLFVNALPGDRKTRDATIMLLQFEKWGGSRTVPSLSLRLKHKTH